MRARTRRVGRSTRPYSNHVRRASAVVGSRPPALDTTRALSFLELDCLCLRNKWTLPAPAHRTAKRSSESFFEFGMVWFLHP